MRAVPSDMSTHSCSISWHFFLSIYFHTIKYLILLILSLFLLLISPSSHSWLEDFSLISSFSFLSSIFSSSPESKSFSTSALSCLYTSSVCVRGYYGWMNRNGRQRKQRCWWIEMAFRWTNVDAEEERMYCTGIILFSVKCRSSLHT